MNEDTKTLLSLYEPKEQKVIKNDRQLFGAYFSPCGRFLVSGDYEARIRRWDISLGTPQELTALEGHNGWPQAMAFHPTDHSLLFTADSWGQIRCWPFDQENPQANWTIENAHDGWVRMLAVSPDGKLLASCGYDKMVCLWSTTDGKKLAEFSDHGEDVFCVAFHLDGKSLVSGDMKGKVKQWDLAQRKCIREFDASILFTEHRLQEVGGVRCFAFSPDGKTLAVGGTKPKNGGNVQGDPTILLFDWKTGKEQKSLTLGKSGDVYVYDIQFHPDGFMIVAISGGPGIGKFLYQRPEDEEPFFITTKMSNCHSVSLHPDGYRIAVTATNRGSNGNGRRLDKDGEYLGNTSPVHLFELPKPLGYPASPPPLPENKTS